MNIMNLYVYENRSMSSDLSNPIMLENLNVDTIQIHIPQALGGVDMSTWAWWFVYQNARKEKYSVPMALEMVENDEGEVELLATVLLNHGYTGKHGSVSYALEAIRTNASGEITGEWHTRTYKHDIIYTLQGNQAQYAETEADVISALINRVNELIQSGAEIAEIAATIEAAAETAQEVIDSIPQDYSALSSDVDDLKSNLGALDDRVDALEGGGAGDGLTEDVKVALMNLVNHVTWDDDDPTGQTYITALYNALYPPAELVSISAVYTQSGVIYESNTLDDLKDDLVVTALMSDQTTRSVTDYSLSGTLIEGTSTITVSYSGKTTTFNVTVSHEAVFVRNIIDYATVVREHAYGVNNSSVNNSWPEVVYSIPNVKSGDVLILPNGSNEATWATYRNIGKVDQSSSVPQITLGEWVKVGSQYGYYPITVNEDLDILYVRFKPAYSTAATWTRESGF